MSSNIELYRGCACKWFHLGCAGSTVQVVAFGKVGAIQVGRALGQMGYIQVGLGLRKPTRLRRQTVERLLKVLSKKALHGGRCFGCGGCIG